MSIELGTFSPYKYSENNKEGKGKRMAGDMLKYFAQGNVAKVLGANSNKDYRNGIKNEKPASQPTATKASNGQSSAVASQPTATKASNSQSAAVAFQPAASAQPVIPEVNAILPEKMQQDMIDRGGKINADGSYVHGSRFESNWNKRNSQEYLDQKKAKDEALYARAGVTNKEDYYKSEAFAAARARAIAEAKRRK